MGGARSEKQHGGQDGQRAGKDVYSKTTEAKHRNGNG
jgi:hypothetical protein